MQIKLMTCVMATAVLLSFVIADGLPYGQERLEQWLYSIEPDDDQGDDEPPYVPHRNQNALTEFRAFFNGSGWTTNQFIDGLILAMTNNLVDAKLGDWEKIGLRVVQHGS